MKVIYPLLCLMLFAQLAYSQQTPPPPSPNSPAETNPNPPAQSQAIPILLQAGSFPGSGTTLDQDYNSIGVNPANLGFSNGKVVVTFGLMQLNGALATNAIGLTALKNIGNDSTPPLQQILANEFANRGVNLSLGIMPVGISVQIPKIGGFAFSWQYNLVFSAYMNPLLASIAFQGYNSPYFTQIDTVNNKPEGITNAPQLIGNAFNGSYIKFSLTQTYTLSYGRELLKFSDNTGLYVGGSLKYIIGLAMGDASATDGGVNGFASYSSSFKTIGDSGSKVNPGSMIISPQPAGKGSGFDLGSTLALNHDIRVGASVTDIGFGDMTWNGNVYQVINEPLDSLRNYEGVKSLVKGGNASTLVYEQPGTYSVALPTQLHLGGSMFLIKKFVVAADIAVPLNSAPGNIPSPTYTLSGGFCPTNYFRVSLGFQNSAFTGITIPLSIMFGTGRNATYQFGASVLNAISIFYNNPNTISLGGGEIFLRFRV